MDSRHAYAYKLVYNRAIELNMSLSIDDFNVYIYNMVKLMHGLPSPAKKPLALAMGMKGGRNYLLLVTIQCKIK